MIQRENSIVCLLPPTIRHTNHAAVVTGDQGGIYAFLLTEDGDVQAWQLVAPPE